MLDGRGVTSIQRVGLVLRQGHLILSVWPGELKPQALWLYEAGRAGRLLGAARESGWEIEATPHLAFRTSWPEERVYLHPAIDPDTYVAQWNGGDLAMIRAHSLDNVPELWRWLHRRGYASAKDSDAERDAFVGRVRMPPVHLRPGLHLYRRLTEAEADRLDADGDLVPSVRGALNRLLDALDEPLLDGPEGEPSSTLRWSRVPLERVGRTSFAVQGASDRHGRRTEALLVERYAASLEPDRLGRARVTTETDVLYSDLLNETRHQLIEAKASATRPSIRMAIGQLADYARYIDPAPALAVLVPVRPSQDLLALLVSVGLAAVWEDGDTFADSAGGRFT